MNTFLADLHIHSRYSRATSTRLTVPHLAAWSTLKGLSVTGTGDFTHPQWRQELQEWLVRDDATGLYRLKRPVDLNDAAEGYMRPADSVLSIPGHTSPESGPLFMLQAEISSIYKKDGAVRKVHNLVYMPDFNAVEALCTKLSAIGNLNADGRPILGLDSRRLLELVLETDPRGVVIPAHVWTPWFSLFGSKSGFNSLEACFGDLSSHIFALETGLSSDPDMNRLWSGLDRLAMVSNSDCHSGENLGREATVFSGVPSYDGLFNALRQAAASSEDSEAPCRYEGTLEFFPEEGKYHLDGHRACNVVLEPEETRRLKGCCPVCGKPVTVGVLHRVTELADRTTPQPAAGTGFASLVPLPELLGELLGTNAKSRKVQVRHAELLHRFGPELHILCGESPDSLGAHWPELGEAVRRMRAGHVHRQGGYDGEYGTVRVFTDEERASLGVKPRRGLLVSVPDRPRQPRSKQKTPAADDPAPAEPHVSAVGGQNSSEAQAESFPHAEGQAESSPLAEAYTPAQQTALAAGPHPVLVLAGPGAGKTRTLIGRMAHLVQNMGVAPESVVAVTFTRRAAAELRERLQERLAQPHALNSAVPLPDADTLHALALRFWPTEPQPAILSEEQARQAFAKANDGLTLSAAQWRSAFDTLSLHRERLSVPDADLSGMAQRYAAYKQTRHLADYTDLLETWLSRLQRAEVTPPWAHVLVDEIQDLSPLQLALVRALLPEDGNGFFGIGDPDQAIYGFRGAHPDVQGALTAHWPNLRVLYLSTSYRAGADILLSATALLGNASRALTAARPLKTRLALFTAPDAGKEAVRVAEEVSILLGTGSHTLTDARRQTHDMAGTCSPSDIAVLVRMKSLMPPLREALHRRGIPVSVPEADPFWQEPRVAVLLGLAGRHYNLPMPHAVPDPSDLPRRAWVGGPESLLTCVESTPPFDASVRDSSAFRSLRKLWAQEGSWPAVLGWVRLRQELDLVRETSETVRIMTLHAAKGLEFRAVFLPCLEDGLLPLNTTLFSPSPIPLSPDAEAEERRLLYVGLTRAAEMVFASHAAQRTLYGRSLTLPPSPFLKALPQCFARSRLVLKRQVQLKQLKLL